MKPDRLLRAGILSLALPVLLAGCWNDDLNFESYVSRQFTTPAEEALIDVAERVCPAREDVLAAASPEDREALETEAGDACLWWYDCVGRRVPYAITADAIAYYTNCVEQNRRDRPILWPSGAYAYFNYRADIEFRGEFTAGAKQYEDAYLVHMVTWYEEGSIFPLSYRGFDMDRTVAISGAGEVLAVFGDGTAEWYQE